jgi:hypothetical protein
MSDFFRRAGRTGRGRIGLPILASLVAMFGVAVPVGPASAASAGYRFTSIASLGDPAPGGGVFTFDFEPSAVNNAGEVAFTADLAPIAVRRTSARASLSGGRVRSRTWPTWANQLPVAARSMPASLAASG